MEDEDRSRERRLANADKNGDKKLDSGIDFETKIMFWINNDSKQFGLKSK